MQEIAFLLQYAAAWQAEKEQNDNQKLFQSPMSLLWFLYDRVWNSEEDLK